MGKIGVLWFQVIHGLFCFSFFSSFACMVMYGKKNSTKDKSQTTRETSFQCYSVEFL